MRNVWTKLLAAVLAVSILLGVAPAMGGMTAPAYAAAKKYGKTTDFEVNVRKSASTSSGILFRVPKGYVCEVVNTAVSGGETWYYVRVVNPESTSGHVSLGYIKGDFFAMLSDAEADVWEANPVQTAVGSTTNPDGSTFPPNAAIGELTSSGVNFREGPSLKSSSMDQLDRGMIVQLF